MKARELHLLKYTALQGSSIANSQLEAKATIVISKQSTL